MNIAVISDLHIGPPGVDLLDHSDDSFIAFLRNLELSYDKIILLGDIIETLMPKTPGQYEKAFWEAWNYRRAITQRFLTTPYEYIFGNHDWIAEKTVGAVERMHLSYRDRRILFLHGHQTDKLYSRRIGESIVFAVGWGIRGGLGRLYRQIAYLETVRHCRNLFFSKEVEEIAENTGSNTIVMGHTHTAMIKDFRDVLYMNSGHCAFGKRNFISMDLDNDKFSIERY